MVYNIVTLALIAIPTYFVLITIYRLTLHPLVTYPGPFLRRITAWPDALDARSGQRHIRLTDLHRKYGHAVRISPNRISLDSAEAFHDVNTNRNANVIKSGFVGFARDITEAPSIQQIADKQIHAQRRKIIGHAFSDTALRSAEDFMLEQIRNWIVALRRGCDKSTDGWSETKDIGHWVNLLTLDVLGELCFGKNFQAINQGDHEFIHQIMRGTKMTMGVAYAPVEALSKPLLRSKLLLKTLSPKIYKARFAFRDTLHDFIKQRKEAELDAEANKTEARKDFFHYVLQGRDDDGNMLPLPVYISEAALLIVAGTDTTSTALATTLFYLNRNPAKLDRLYKELRQTFPSVEDIHTGPQLSSMTYLRACVDEALRMVPPVPGPLTKMALKGGATVDGTHFDEGIDIEVPIFSLHHNADYFPDPDTYLPERWIVGSKTPNFEVTEALVSRQRNAFVPFSTGSRNCLGMRMAYMEMGLVMSRLLYTYETRFDPQQMPTTKDFETQDWFISGKRGPYLQFRPRESM